MLREERLQFILNKLEKEQRVSSTKLIDELRVSEGTIRRDLNELQDKGLLKKVHGGAVPGPEAPAIFAGREEFAFESKGRLAEKALLLLRDHMLVIMDGGTSNWHIAKLLPKDIRLTIFTNSIPIVSELMDHRNVELFLLGGKVFKSSRVTVDVSIYEVLREIHADLAFIGIRSIHPEIGLTTLQHEEARLKRKMIDSSRQVVALATNDKLDTADQYKICDYQDLDVLIVEDTAEEGQLESYRKQGVRIL